MLAEIYEGVKERIDDLGRHGPGFALPVFEETPIAMLEALSVIRATLSGADVGMIANLADKVDYQLVTRTF